MATYYWVGSNIDDFGNTPNVPYDSWLNQYNWVNSPDYPNSGVRGWLPAAGDTVYFQGGNFTGNGSAAAIIVSGLYTNPTVQVGGMGMIDGASLTDSTATVDAVSTGVGLHQGSTWTNTASLTTAQNISLFEGSRLIDPGSDSIGVGNTLAELSVDGPDSTYSNTGGVLDDGLIEATNGGTVSIGGDLSGTGALTIGGQSSTGSADASGTVGTVTLGDIAVTGTSSLRAGSVAVAQFQVVNSSTATVSSISVASYLTVGGPGSVLTDSGALTLGNGAGSNAEIQIDGGATLSLASSELALGTGGVYVSVFLSGSGSTLGYAGPVTLGSDGSGQLSLSDGAQYAVAGSLLLGNGATGSGQVDVSGAGSSLGVSGALTLAGSLLDDVSLYSGGTLTAASLALGVDNTGTLFDVVQVSADALLAISGDASVGAAGLGALGATNGGTITLGTLAVATTTGTAGSYASHVDADGSGAQLLDAGNATIDAAVPLASNDAGQPNGRWGNWAYGVGAFGQLVASDEGFVSIGGTLSLQVPDNAVEQPAVSVNSGGSLEVGGRSRGAANSVVVDTAGLIIGEGTIEAATDPSTETFDGTIDNNGTIEARSGTLELGGTITGVGTYRIDPDATLRLNGTVDADAKIVFGGSYDTTLVLDMPSAFEATLTGFRQGEAIVLSGAQLQPPTPGAVTVTYSDGALSLAGVGSLLITGVDPEPTFAIGVGVTGPRIETTSVTTLLDLAFNTYSTPTAQDGYNVLTSSTADAGFFAAAYVDSNPDDPDPDIVISFRGTSLSNQIDAFKNILADASFLTGQPNAILRRYVLDAANFIAQVVNLATADYSGQAPLITLTGHSLGGALAELLGEADGFAAAGFDAPGAGQLYDALTPQLAPAANLGGGGTVTNYRLSGDQVSEAGTPVGATYTIASPYTPDNALLPFTVVNALNNHGVGIGGYHYAFQNLTDASAYTPGLAGPDLISQLQAAIQSPQGTGLVTTLNVIAGIASALDPGGGSSFVLTETADSPALSAIDLPIISGVDHYDVAYDSGGAFSAMQSVASGTSFALPAGTTAVSFAPIDGSGDAVTLDDAFFFSATFATSGTFIGTLTATGASPGGQPVTTPGTATLVLGAAATPLGIAAPTDPAYVDPSNLAVQVTALPTDAHVFLADGIIAVSAGDLLTVAQLAGLTAAAAGPGTSVLSYQVSDPDFASTNGAETIEVACFRAGTRIATPDGDIAVERLVAGDLVCAGHAGIAAVVWFGQRRVDCRSHPAPQKVWPVRVRAGAFGPGRPHSDLFLSPDHAVLFDEVLIPVRLLIDGDAVAQIRVDDVQYVHLELQAHDTVLAEGLACESFLDTGQRAAFSSATPTVLHPDFSPLIWDGAACAPLVLSGALLTAARHHLATRGARPQRRCSIDHFGQESRGMGAKPSDPAVPHRLVA